MILPDSESLAVASADWLAEGLRGKPDALVCIASGHTQSDMLAILCQRAIDGRIDLSRLRMIGLDEWIGLGPEDEGSCQHILENKFFKPAGLREDQITFFHAKTADLDDECERIDRYLDEAGPIDLLILGVGMNGHIGFNEPGSPLHNRTYHRDLDPVSSRIGQKYFTKPRELKRGITLGLKDLTQARKILIQVNGEDKAPVVRAFLAQPHQLEQPASHFWPLQSTTLLLDRAAARLLPASPIPIFSRF